MRITGLKRWAMGGAAALMLPLGACVTHTHQESAALPQPWPKADRDLQAYGPASSDYPSGGGDILKGFSPADLAAARAAAIKPLDAPDPPAAQAPPPPPRPKS